eukprot:373344_1
MALRWDARQIIGCVHCKTTVTWRNYSRHSQIIHNVIFSKDDVQCHIRSADVFVHGYIRAGIICGVKRIQYFIKIYYQFVGKYRNTGKGGRANFGFKIHLLWHVCDWIEYFGISPAHIDEQRIEHLHVVINRAIKMFGAVQGRDKLKHIMRYVSLHSLYA